MLDRESSGASNIFPSYFFQTKTEKENQASNCPAKTWIGQLRFRRFWNSRSTSWKSNFAAYPAVDREVWIESVSPSHLKCFEDGIFLSVPISFERSRIFLIQIKEILPYVQSKISTVHLTQLKTKRFTADLFNERYVASIFILIFVLHYIWPTPGLLTTEFCVYYYFFRS